MWFLRQLFAPFNYLRVEVGEGWLRSKKMIDLIAPSVLAILFVAVHRYALSDIEFFGNAQFASKFAKFFELLAAFFIAALAAVAALERKSLDLPLRGAPATLFKWINAENRFRRLPLTRRQFVCYLFAYLSALTLVVNVSLPFCEAYVAACGGACGSVAHRILWFLGRLAFFWVLANVLITSLFGIYFLSDRIQDHDDNR